MRHEAGWLTAEDLQIFVDHRGDYRRAWRLGRRYAMSWQSDTHDAHMMFRRQTFIAELRRLSAPRMRPSIYWFTLGDP